MTLDCLLILVEKKKSSAELVLLFDHCRTGFLFWRLLFTWGALF